MILKNELTKVAHFFRWRLIASRLLYRAMQLSSPDKSVFFNSKLASTKEIDETGFRIPEAVSDDIIAEIEEIYRPRVKEVKVRKTGSPFQSLFKPQDITIDNPIIRLAFSNEILDSAIDYFGGNIFFDKIQLLYSYPTHSDLRESQKWHKDFADNKSFHSITYVNDVNDDDDGPFVFIDRKLSKRMKKSMLVRRINDEQFIKELGDGEIQRLYGKKGTTLHVDPAVCYHYGSRCVNPRMAIFITFSSAKPYLLPMGLVKNHKNTLYEVGRQLRPDLDDNLLRAMLRIDA